MSKKFYELDIMLDLSEIDKEALRDNVDPEITKAYQEKFKKWSKKKKGDAPEVPVGNSIGPAKAFLNLTEQAVTRQYPQSDKRILSLCKSIAAKFKWAIENDDAKALVFTKSEFDFFKNLYEKESRWPNEKNYRTLVGLIDEKIQNIREVK